MSVIDPITWSLREFYENIFKQGLMANMKNESSGYNKGVGLKEIQDYAGQNAIVLYKNENIFNDR